MAYCTSYREIAREEVGEVISESIESGDSDLRIGALQLTASLAMLGDIYSGGGTWADLEDELLESYSSAVPEAATFDLCVLTTALSKRILSLREFLVTPGGLTALLSQPINAFYPMQWASHLESLGGADFVSAMADVGNYLRQDPQVPWASAVGKDAGYIDELHPRRGADLAAIKFTGDAYLGYAAIAAILTETGNLIKGYPAAIRDFDLYTTHRMHPEQRQSLPELPVPDEFKQVFRDWAEGKVNFTGHVPD